MQFESRKNTKENIKKNYFYLKRKYQKNCSRFLRLMNPKAESLAIFLTAQKYTGMIKKDARKNSSKMFKEEEIYLVPKSCIKFD